ncbi:UNKNOWN [Stylonychia lemnae]|uniref:Uncharacterized protein n=1 Tax=Stylonychia lemnae TaxID=5949 RepID=A0A078ABC9_STYLE|nr:UNKNOWN [Stylonychia lemnae]|eukprot:CDW78098.1 UNKNOWN [Stylonychia lemnae]
MKQASFAYNQNHHLHSIVPSENLMDDNEDDPIHFFNGLKEIYSMHIESLTSLKRMVFSSQNEAFMDQHQKSKIRINIESLLIDLNEEVFSLSEELTRSITKGFSKVQIEPYKRVEFEDRLKHIQKKIKDNIDENPCIKIIRRNMRIQNQTTLSPPQRDIQSHQQTIDQDHQRRLSPQKNYEAIQPMRNYVEPPLSTRQYGDHGLRLGSDQKNFETLNPYKGGGRNSLTKKKSPTPLRRKDLTALQSGSKSFVQQNSGSKNRSNHSQTRNNQSAQRQLQFKTMDYSSNNQKKHNHDQGVRQMPANAGKNRLQTKKQEKLDEFEKFLAMKTQKGMPINSQKENLLPSHSLQTNYESKFAGIEGFSDFAKDFSLMKNKILQLQQSLAQNEEKTNNLESQVDKLKTENLKLTTDVKIIRNEHSEILHKLVNIDKKNQQLYIENEILRKQITEDGNMINKSYDQRIASGGDQMSQSFDKQNEQRKLSPFQGVLNKDRSFSNSRDDSVPKPKTIQIQKPSTSKNMNAEFLSFQPSLNQTYHNQTLSEDGEMLKQQLTYNDHNFHNQPSTYHNPLLSISNERIYAQNNNRVGVDQNSFHLSNKHNPVLSNQSQNQSINHSRIVSANFNPQINISNMNIQETPNTPNQMVMVMSDETPRGRRNDGIPYLHAPSNLDTQSRSKQYVVGKGLTPSGSNQNLGQMQLNEQEQLSDWVIERMRLQQK